MEILGYIIILVTTGINIRNLVKEHQSFNSKYFEGCTQFNSIHYSILTLIISAIFGLAMMKEDPAIGIGTIVFLSLISSVYINRVIVSEEGITLRRLSKEQVIRWEDMISLKVSRRRNAYIQIETSDGEIKHNIYCIFKLGVLTRYLNDYAYQHDINFNKTGIALI